MHDIADLESRGIPGAFLASTEFIQAAEAQSNALGFTPAAVFIQHPIQDRTDEELIQLTDEAFDRILQAVCEG